MEEQDEATPSSTGSDVHYDFYCQMCRDDGLNIEADGYCVDCQEYLCEACVRGHRKSRQTRYHYLQDKSSMPRDTPLPVDHDRTDITTTCQLHPGAVVEFFCKDHGIFLCKTFCLNSHKECTGLKSIEDESKGILDGEELAELIQSLNSFDQKSRDIVAKARTGVEETKACQSDVLKSIKVLRQQVNAAFDRLEKTVQSEVDLIASEEEKKIATITTLCSNVADLIEEARAHFENLKSTRRACQVYIAMKERHEDIQNAKSNIRIGEQSSVGRKFRFEPNIQFQESVNSKHGMGRLVFDPKAEPVKDIRMKHDSDEMDCRITGSSTVSMNRLIIADGNNECVKLVDTERGNIISKIDVAGSPWDVAVVDRNRAAVTVSAYFVSKVILLRLGDTLSQDYEIAVGGLCRGVASYKDKLILTYTNTHRRVEIRDLQGTVEKTIWNSAGSMDLFKWPHYVCVRKENPAFIVSDKFRQSVTCFAFNGDVKGEYSKNGLNSPGSVCLDHLGNVYVCDSNNIYVLTKDITNANNIVSLAEVGGAVRSVSHCEDTDRLFVGVGNHVKVFQLSR